MRRHLLSSLLGCRLTSSAALLLVGHNLLFHYNFSGSYKQQSDDFLSPGSGSFQQHGIRSTVALCEKSPFINGDRGEDEKEIWSVDQNIRTCNTHADLYFSKYRRLPLPRTMHKVLTEKDECQDDPSTKRGGILVIGDVHGCFEELQMLHKAAVEANDNTPFRFVILVGDMCNKGPYSAEVIRFVRQQKNWFAVRGNHDNAALQAALGHEWRRAHAKYNWVIEGERMRNPPTDRVVFSDEDVVWMSELPYTLTIPASLFDNNEEEEVDTVVVHAGLVPGVPLDIQEIGDMIHLREVVEVYSNTDEVDEETGEPPIQYAHHRVNKPPKHATPQQTVGVPLPLPWAAVWKGPPRVIFGHDAKRGFQRYNGDWVFGLDTGACYGNQLTGIILPEKRIVSVDALAAHCAIEKKKHQEAARKKA